MSAHSSSSIGPRSKTTFRENKKASRKNEKEGLILIFDVSRNTRYSGENEYEKRNSFFEKQIAFCSDFIQRKIYYNNTDEIAIILSGTKNTKNTLNQVIDGYTNITEICNLAPCSWAQMVYLMNALKNEPGAKSGDWIDALIVALDLLERQDDKFFKYSKIVIFHQFNTAVDASSVEMAIAGIKAFNVELVVINNNVLYVDNIEKRITTGIFQKNADKTTVQCESEALVMQVINECGGILCNWDMASHRVMYPMQPRGRPWFWNSVLEIGSKIKIDICATIAITAPKPLKFQKKCIDSEMNVWTVDEYFINGDKIQPEPQEIVKGYMLGTTPIAYDDTLGIIAKPTVKGMKCIAFTHKSFVPPEYLCGDSTYIVLPKNGKVASEKKMTALVQAMNQLEFIMIARRVYNNKNRPNFVALLPNLERDRAIPCLTMINLLCSEQFVNLDFLSLLSKKTQPTKDQYAVVDELIEAMDIDDVKNQDYTEPRNRYYKEFLDLRSLTSKDHKNIEIIETLVQDDFNMEALNQNREIDVKIPEENIDKLNEAIEKFKAVFDLKEIEKKKITTADLSTEDDSKKDGEAENEDDIPRSYRSIHAVGTINPADDYITLVMRNVENEDDSEIQRANFDNLSNQVCNIIYDLIFKSITPQLNKIEKTIQMYREQAIFYNPWGYNDWIKQIKSVVIARNMIDFWENMIVKNDFGLLSAKNCDFFDNMDDPEPEEFYKIQSANVSTKQEASAPETLDDLFDNM